jgi:hypothetical protein
MKGVLIVNYNSGWTRQGELGVLWLLLVVLYKLGGPGTSVLVPSRTKRTYSISLQRQAHTRE